LVTESGKDWAVSEDLESKLEIRYRRFNSRQPGLVTVLSIPYVTRVIRHWYVI